MPPTLYWKRGHLILVAGELAVAGAFARVPVPLEAKAPGAPGFSAHASRLGAHRYEPRTGTLLGVELSPVVDQGNGYVTGIHQVVKAVELSRVCAGCGGSSVPGYYRTAPFDEVGELLASCIPCASTCPDAPGGPLTSSPLVTYRTASLERWSRMPRPRQTPATKCACALTSVLDPTHGLRWYLAELWAFEAPIGDGQLMRCVVCGTRWLYRRTALPVEARRIDH